MDKKYIWAEDPRPVCVIPDGGFSSLSQIGDDCKLPQDYSGPLVTFGSQIVDKHGHILDGDSDPHGKNGCDHRDTKEWKAEHRVHKKVEKKEIKQEQPVTVATVQIPSRPLDIPKPPQKMDTLASLPMLTGAIAGAVSSAVGPMAANFIKGLLKNLLKSNKSNSKEEKKEQPTDCKTSQLNAFARFRMLEAKISALESKDNAGGFSVGGNSLEELIERIENLEKGRKKPKEKI